MAIKADRSDLPKAQGQNGHPPDPQPRFAQILVDHLQAQRAEDGEKATADGTRIRHSDAGKCARALSLKAAGFPAEPMDAAGVHVTNLGTLVHDAWQEALADELGDAVEVEVTCQVGGLDASGHLDAVIEVPVDDDGNIGDPETATGVRRIAYELKTVGGFGYKKAVGERGAPEGPRFDAFVQGALNAYAADCDELIVGYLATEAISKQAADRARSKGASIDELGRFVAEWTYTREQFEPWAKHEAARLQRVLDLLDDGWVAPRSLADPEVPSDALIVDPDSGRWELREKCVDAIEPCSEGKEDPEHHAVLDAGETWRCAYCPMRPACVATGEPGAVDVEKAGVAIEKVMPF